MAELTANFNYLQPTSFKLTLDRTNYPNLEFFCQSFVHPGMIMNSVEVPYKKIAGVPFIGDKLTFNELQANILLDEDMKSYKKRGGRSLLSDLIFYFSELCVEDVINTEDSVVLVSLG